MSTCASIEFLLGNSNENNPQYLQNNTFSFKIPLSCPFCVDQDTRVSTWGTYSTKIDEKTRYYCYECNSTFNAAKIPFWKDNLHELVWKLAQLTVEDKLSVHSFSKKWNIPETTLRVLITELKDILASSFEQAKQLDQIQNNNPRKNSEQFRVIAYDEGFLKLLGIQSYLIFTLDKNGRPLTLCIEDNREAETIYNHFLSAVTQMGGVDVIISDGAPAILSAARALRQNLLLIMQIHQGDGKRARLIKLKTIDKMKKMEETTIELHTGSLLPNTESELTVSKKTIYPKKYSGSSIPSQIPNKEKKPKSIETLHTKMLTPKDSLENTNLIQKGKSRLLKGQKIILTTGNDIGIFELSYLDPLSFTINESTPTLQEIQGMIYLVQNVLPNQWITSNRAEVFNALHDHVLTYQGKKSINQANRDLLAWAVMKFYPNMAKNIIKSHYWNIPNSLLMGLWPFLISKVRIS